MDANHQLLRNRDGFSCFSNRKKSHCVQGFLLCSLLYSGRFDTGVFWNNRQIALQEHKIHKHCRLEQSVWELSLRSFQKKATWRGPEVPGTSPERQGLTDSESRRHSPAYQSPRHFPLCPKPTKWDRKDPLPSLGFSLLFP